MSELNQSSELAERYARDGVIYLPQAIDLQTLKLAEQCYDWSLANPTPSACHFYEAERNTFYQDLCNPQAAHAYRELLENHIVTDVIGNLWGQDEVWFLYEQVFLKEGDVPNRRTPWHQDTPYLALDGSEIAVMWINFEAVEKAQSLEFVRGSHRQTLYDGSAFDPTDDTQPIYGHDLPRLPNIEAQRDEWDIVSWAVEPGDVVIFHPSTLHGGAPTVAGTRRRTLSLRFFGPDAQYATRPADAPAPLIEGIHETLKDGHPFRHPAFPRLRPTPAGFDEIPAQPGHKMRLKAQIQGQID